MGIAAGIDLGGTKIEARVFGADWAETDRRRIDTPADYDALVGAVADQIRWAVAQAGGDVPVGIGAAGLVSPVTGEALTANLPATGRTFPADIEARAGRAVTYVNDCRSFTLSEAVFGAGKGLSPVIGLTLGTGVAGGVVVDGALVAGPGQFGGEFGHLPAPADILMKHGLPVFTCGCGRPGCIETYISGLGLARLAKHLTGRDATAREVAEGRHDEWSGVWAIWRELVADHLRMLALVIDPEAIVLGGGLSGIDGLLPELSEALGAIMWPGYPAPRLLLAQGGDASGARGAAYAAWLANGSAA